MAENQYSIPEAADILVVDDTIASLRLLTEILGKGGYRVRPADEPHLALQSAQAQPPSLILLDVRMPGMDGFEVCRRLKQDERTRDVPVIFVSALHDVDDRVQGFEVGGVDFVSKPIEEAEVLARVKTHLLLWTMRRHLEELVAERTAELVQTNEALLSEIAERNRAEEALQQSEERHRLLFENASLGIGYYTPDGRVIAFNKVAAEQLNGKPEDYVGRSLSDLFGPEAGAVYAERIETASGSPESLEFEDHVSLQSGDKWFLATYNRIANASDQIVGVQIISNDITERKQAEEALKESEERFRSLVEQSPISIQIHAPDGRLVQSNAAYARLYALNREALAELYEKHNVLQDEQAKRLGIMPFIEGTFAGEEVVFPPYEYDGIDTLKTLDFDNPISRRCWVQTRGFPLRGQDGRVASFVFMSEDITERKQGEEALRESEARYRSLVEQAQDGIAVLQDGKVRFANSYIAGLSGRTVEELLDTPFEAYLTVDQRPKIADIYRRRMNGEAVSSIYESAIEHRDGSRVEVEFNAGLTTYEGKPADLVIVRDITERRKAKSALRESEEKLRAIYEAIPVATYTWQREGEDFVLVDYNEMAVKITEGRIVDLVGERASEMYRDLPEIPEAMTRCSSERLTIEEEMDYHLITTGRRRHLNVKYAFAPPDLVVVHTEDITARKRVEEELRKSNERLEEAQRTAQIGDWEYDILAGKATWSDEMYRICGVDPEQYVPTAKSDEEFCHPDDVPALREAYERFFAGGEPLDLDYRIVTPQGVAKACRRRGRLIVNAEGAPSLAIGTTEDITERWLVEQQILEYQQRLQTLVSLLTISEERERRRIARELHDEVGQTLAFARTGLASARKTPSEARRDAILDDVSQSLRQAIRDTRDLIFDLSSPLMNELGLGAALGEWLEDQVGKKHGLQTEFIYDGQRFPLDDDMRAILFRCTRELLTNVVKHAQAKRVTVRLEAEGTLVRIAVEDDGIGFDVDAIPGTMEREGGFGLFSIQERMADLGGSLEIQSSPGQGCTAILTAPVTIHQAPASQDFGSLGQGLT